MGGNDVKPIEVFSKAVRLTVIVKFTSETRHLFGYLSVGFLILQVLALDQEDTPSRLIPCKDVYIPIVLGSKTLS